MSDIAKMVAIAKAVGGNPSPGGTPSAGGVQADWNAKEGEAGHIANRTHYEEKTLLDILPETTFTEDMANEGMFLVTSPLGGSISDGETYTVNWNGTEYACTAKGISGDGVDLVCLGDVGMMGVGASTGEPFLFAGAPAEMAAAGVYAQIIPLDGSTSVTIKVTGLATIVHELDKKFVQKLLFESLKNFVRSPENISEGDLIFYKGFNADGTPDFQSINPVHLMKAVIPNPVPAGVVVYDREDNIFKTTPTSFVSTDDEGIPNGIIIKSSGGGGKFYRIGVLDNGNFAAWEHSGH